MFIVVVAGLVNYCQNTKVGVATLGESIALPTTTVMQPQIFLLQDANSQVMSVYLRVSQGTD